MKNQTDPVVQDLTEWINRSAGQHQRRISEGTESARRLLHIVDTSQLGERDGVSVGACCTGDCNQGRDCPDRESGEVPLFDSVLLWVACCVLLIAALAATAPELVLMLLGVI